MTRAEIAQIRALYQELGNIKRVAEQMGLCYNTIKKHVRKLPKQRKPYQGQRVDSRKRIQVGDYWRYLHQLDTWKVVKIEEEKVFLAKAEEQREVTLQEQLRPKEWALDWRHMKKQ